MCLFVLKGSQHRKAESCKHKGRRCVSVVVAIWQCLLQWPVIARVRVLAAEGSQDQVLKCQDLPEVTVFC